MSKFARAIAWLASMLSSAFIGMALAALAIHLADRFTDNDTSRSFYLTEKDVTCFLVKTRGQQLMDCLPGEYGNEEYSE